MTEVNIILFNVLKRIMETQQVTRFGGNSLPPRFDSLLPNYEWNRPCVRLYTPSGNDDRENSGRCPSSAIRQVRFSMKVQSAHWSQSPYMDSGRDQNSVHTQRVIVRSPTENYNPRVLSRCILVEHKDRVES